MRLEVFCEDRLGLTRELLDLLVLRGIDLRGIEIDPHWANLPQFLPNWNLKVSAV